MKIQTLSIVGVGLIGGSVALAARRRGVAQRVRGVDQDPAVLDQARGLGVIDDGSLDLADGVRGAEVVVFCTPVDRLAALVRAAAPHCAPGALLTDVGSTKTAVMRDAAGRLPAGVVFVGGHPLAGSEKRGPAHADADLFQNRLAVVTPAPDTPAEAVERAADLWRSLGARVRVMGAEEHDRALAFTSHLPQLAASALAGVLPPELAELTATGFRDTTRLAGSHPAMWVGIFTQNRGPVLDALARLQQQLDRFRAALQAADVAAIEDLLSQGRRVREALNG
jgi:prephenate dehydrogenase